MVTTQLVESGVGTVMHDPSTYKRNGLPHGKDLKCQKTKEELQKVFAEYAGNADKLASLGSSNASEGVNSIISSKQPKSRSYTSSRNLIIETVVLSARKT